VQFLDYLVDTVEGCHNLPEDISKLAGSELVVLYDADLIIVGSSRALVSL